MTITDNKLQIALYQGKIEGFRILYGHTKESQHKKLLDDAETKLKELETVLKAAEAHTGIQGQLIFRIIIKDDASDFAIDTDFVASDEVKKHFGVIPGALTAADILLSVCESSLQKFGAIAEKDPAAAHMLNRLALLQNMLVEWAQKWGGSLLALQKDLIHPKSKIITNLKRKV